MLGWRAAATAAWLAALLLGAALILAPPAAAQSPTPTPTPVDYDDDNDGLIDVRNLAQLNAIRYDLNGNGDATSTQYAAAFPNRVTTASGRMGCPSGTCTGYELRADLSFDENGDGQMTSAGDPTYWNSGNGWLPMGNVSTFWSATFRGNGHTIGYLRISRASTAYVGLFGQSAGAIDGVGLPHADVTGANWTGILVGAATGGTIDRAWTTGRVHGSQSPGGVYGWGTTDVRASWSTATVSGGTSSFKAGGLIGYTEGSVTASWSGGRVASSNGGGLVGAAGSGGTATDSYWDAGTSGQSTSALGTSRTTRDLQRPTAYGSTGSIYANWNLNLDGDANTDDDPWDFGTSRQYPALKFTGRTTRGPASIEADHWNSPVAGEPIVAGLYSKTSRALVSPAATITTYDGVANTDSRQAWVWERSDDGRTSWTDVSSSNGSTCSYVYVPSSGDAGKYLRARVPRTSGGNAYTPVTAAVVASSAATSATATFAGGNASPVVGTAVTVSALPTGHSDRTVWRWQRCTANDGTGTCTLLAPGTPSWSYTPVAADVGGYLRAFVYYSSSASTPVWTRAATGFTGAVAASN